MKSQFTQRITPAVNAELTLAKAARAQGDTVGEFHHLENAHVLGQRSTWLHVKVHLLMMLWGFRNRSLKEVAGQLFRTVGAATKTAIGLIPDGNTGGANISPFKPLALSKEHAALIEKAQQR
jgi:hypothetical protein